VYSSTVLASPTVNIDTKYYSIYGSSSKELRKEMNAKGSIGHSGNTYDAYTSWYINWRLNWNMNNGECHMTNVTSTCSALERKANTLGKNILNKYISIEKTYDQKNNHGISNGAKFP
jgi:predicted secreted Zn-dependent protease